MGQGIGGVLEQLIGPPGGFILLAVFGLLVMRRYQRAGKACAVTGLVLLYVVSLPLTSDLLMQWWQPDSSLFEQSLMSAEQASQAIVILGAGRRENAPEFAGDTPSAFALERIRYGVWLARRTQLPLLVSGGLGTDDRVPEAELMKQVIEKEYIISVKWLEKQSKNTHENAEFSAKILKAEGIDSIYLVTHAFHMRRSLWSFAKAGLMVVPAPTAFYSESQREISLRHFFPSAISMQRSALVFHEVVGSLWYYLRY